MSIKDLFQEYYSPLCNYATKIVNNNDIAEDIVQGLFIQLWENDKVTTIDKPERFLLRSTKFKCIDYLRKQTTQKEVAVDSFSDFGTVETADMDEQDIEPLLLFFASKLPPKTREVFLLSRKSGLTYREIAEEQGVSIKTVENQMGKALKEMRSLLKTHDFFALLVLLKIF
ncbi:RNA polymerase sigma-70 factor [Aquimarina sp. TRL1]|uniref:RNA polymerase sigma-70 factor n=1 Tax=Aquimarina sp. (strain TRL1) TaxID=2736252 RepID=UPI00158C74A6|nr:RNA polymerase sigma-70 factor [Aquimarina sp. TRL1]QKX06414.1 RNA polymerase sigma-70 factor [Aquimarina sp. TRL1]